MDSFLKQNKWPIITIILSILALAIAGYFIFRAPSSAPDQPKISLSIDAPNQISSGSEIVYKINVENKDNASIKNISLDVIYPQGFSYADSVPKPTKLNGTQFSLPIIDPAQSASIMIKGNIQGNADETKTLSAVMHYQFSNASANFIAQAQGQSQIKTANIVLQFDGQATANNAQDLSYILNYSNYTDQVVSNFKITLTLPKNFNLKRATPPASLGNNVWQFGDLAAGANGKIVLLGSFQNALSGDQQVFTAKAEGSSAAGPVFVLSAAELPIAIAATPLATEVHLQNSTAESVKPGASLSYEISYVNNSPDPISGVTVTATVSGPFDLSSLRPQNGRLQGNVVSWDASGVPNLAAVGAGAGGKLVFTVNVKNPPTKANDKNMLLTVQPAMQSSRFQQPFDGLALTLKIESSPSLATSATYQAGAKPLTVNQGTSYAVEIDLRNGTNDVTGATMTMNLPNTFNFDLANVNTEERGNVNYDRSTKKIIWNVGTLAANAGSFSAMRKLILLVTVIPGASSGGQPITLVNNIDFSGVDSFTNKSIELSKQDLSTLDDTAGVSIVQ